MFYDNLLQDQDYLRRSHYTCNNRLRPIVLIDLVRFIFRELVSDSSP